MYSELRQRAIEYAQNAVQKDKAGDQISAFKSYYQAADILLQLADTVKAPNLKKKYLSLAETYIRRCYTLQNRKSSKSLSHEDIRSPLEINNHQHSEILYEEVKDLVVPPTDNTQWSDVIGLEKAKSALKEAIILPLMKPEWFKGTRKPWSGILLFGPPGCGKTLLARSAANEIGAVFLNVDATAIFSKWVGESEKRLRAIFNYARDNSPSVIFLDEVDALVSSRGSTAEIGVEKRIKTQFMMEIDGILSNRSKQVLVLGATNLPWELDQAIRRRFEKRIYIPPPDKKARQKLFQMFTRDLTIKSIDYSKLADLTAGYTGADLSLVCREASMIPIREVSIDGKIPPDDLTLRDLTQEDLVTTLNHIEPSIEQKEIQRYEDWASRFQTA
ncbi:MAG: AAA family ATPase [Candidatus Ranarchaeia archaeon]|jgi:vacuolar protein-sorting-associated protein 4